MLRIPQFFYEKEDFFLSFMLNKFFNVQGVANRGCSIRVGRETEKQGKGTVINSTMNMNKLL